MLTWSFDFHSEEPFTPIWHTRTPGNKQMSICFNSCIYCQGNNQQDIKNPVVWTYKRYMHLGWMSIHFWPRRMLHINWKTWQRISPQHNTHMSIHWHWTPTFKQSGRASSRFMPHHLARLLSLRICRDAATP